MSVHILMTLFQSLSSTVGIVASASATLVATVMDVPTIACAPIFWTLLIGTAAIVCCKIGFPSTNLRCHVIRQGPPSSQMPLTSFQMPVTIKIVIRSKLYDLDFN